MSRERKVALGSLTFLVVLLGSLILYQRFAATPQPAGPQTGQEVDQLPAVDAAGTDLLGAGAPSTEEVSGRPGTAIEAPRQLLLPLAGKPKVLQGYAFMFSDTYGDFRLHPGIDYAAAPGDSVLAVATGRIIRIEQDPLEGQLVELDHGNGLVTRYGGLGKLQVGMNASVQTGTVIAQIAPGDKPHLHFEVLLNGSPVDPATYFAP
jgi:murein DD-endopeptidase MepM/ murein hydrolase activator NlpD